MPWRVRQATPPPAKVPPARRNAVASASPKPGGKAAAMAEEEKVQVPASSKPTSCALHISNFLRPFTQNQVRPSHVYRLRCVCASDGRKTSKVVPKVVASGAQQSRTTLEARCFVALAFLC